MDRPAGRAIDADVAVVGAGIAGLTAAAILAREGREVAVIEARDRVGGRVLNVDIGGHANELGGQWVAPYQSAAHELIGELGLELFHAYREGHHVYVDPDGRGRRFTDDASPLPGPSQRAYDHAVARLNLLASSMDPEAPWEHPDAAELDATPFEAWVRREIDDPLGRELLRSFLSDGFMTKPADTFSVLGGLATIAGAGSVENLFESDLCLHSRVVGGSQAIPLRLAERLGDRVLLGAPVRSCAWGPGGVRLAAGGVTVSARHAVVAVPPNLTSAISWDPPLPAWRMRLEQSISQGSVIKVLAVYDEPFWRADGLSGEGFGLFRIVNDVYDNTPPAGTPGVLCTFLAADTCIRVERLSAAERRAAVLDGLAAYVGPRALAASDVIELNWSAEAWSRGAYAATFGVGGLGRFGPDLRRSIGPLHWASSDIAGVGHMHMDGAIRSGTAAAHAVLDA